MSNENLNENDDWHFVAKGGQGFVYKSNMNDLALKKAKNNQNILGEMKVLSILKTNCHEHVCKIIDFCIYFMSVFIM